MCAYTHQFVCATHILRKCFDSWRVKDKKYFFSCILYAMCLTLYENNVINTKPLLFCACKRKLRHIFDLSQPSIRLDIGSQFHSHNAKCANITQYKHKWKKNEKRCVTFYTKLSKNCNRMPHTIYHLSFGINITHLICMHHHHTTNVPVNCVLCVHNVCITRDDVYYFSIFTYNIYARASMCNVRPRNAHKPTSN